MTGICQGRVAIVTGAGRGIGRVHALELARQGAHVVVNDLGVSVGGEGSDTAPAQAVVDEIEAAGGVAVANTDDVAHWDGARAMVEQAIEELERHGVTVNAIAPGARTRMTENLGGMAGQEPAEGEWDPRSPDNVAPLVTWLASSESAGITGQVFLVGGGRIAVAEGWRRGPGVDHGARWDPAELGKVVPDLVDQVSV